MKPVPVHHIPIQYIIILSVITLLLFQIIPSPAFGIDRSYSIAGQSMGTFYTIKFISNKKESTSLWKKKVTVRLNELNQKFSIFENQSEILRFNTMKPYFQLKVSKDFYTVLVAAQNLYEITGGAWDGTIKPLVDLWGFGTSQKPNHIPDNQAILSAKHLVGFDAVKLFDKRFVQKNNPVSLDLGSIAKGYGVDMLASMFEASHINDFLIEVGGELSASGKNHKDKFWTVGISRPEKNIARQKLFKIIQLENQAIATSGNYRNYFEIDGTTYSHIINPKTGYPVVNNIVSATVVANTCTFADGLATALMVMSIKEGIKLVNTLKETECLIVEKKEEDLISHMSDNFETLIKN